MLGVRQNGFTLIELMLAVAILSILAAIAIHFYEGNIGEARISTAISDIRQAELMLDDLASDSQLDEFDGDGGTVLGLYLNSGVLVLSNPNVTPSGTDPWLDPWDRIYRYQRTTGNAGDGVRTDASGNVSNTATTSQLPQAYDLFSQGPDASAASDDIVRGCNGAFVGVHADHPAC